MSPQSGHPREGALQRFVRRAGELVGARADEAPALVAAALFQFSFVGGVAVLKAASNALLVGTQSLPLLYVASSLVTGGVAALAAVVRTPKRWPPTMTFALWVGAILLLAAGVHLQLPFAVDGLYLAAEVYATTLSVRFWARVGELFDVRRSRKVLGVIGGVGMAGSIFGGFLTRTLGERVGALRLVPGACLTLVLCLVLAGYVQRETAKPAAKAAPARAPAAPAPSGTRRYLLGDGLPRMMAAFAAFAAMATAFADFLFRARAKELLDHGAQAALYGELSAVIGVVAMTMQLALTGPLLKRIGLFGYLAITPVGCLLFASASFFTPSLWPVYALKAVEQVGALSLTQTGMQLLYGPMPDQARAGARNAIDGFAKKGGYALGGVLLFALAARLPHAQMPWIVVAVSVGALVVIMRVRVHYVRAVSERLKSSDAIASDDLSLTDGTSRKLLEQAIDSDDPGKVLTSLELLARDRGAKLEPLLVKLLEHRSYKVRCEAAKLAGDRGAQSCAVRLAQMAQTDEAPVREAAIDAVARLRPFTAARLLGPLLTHTDLGTRAAAIAALVPLDPGGPAGKALAELLDRGADAMPGERAQVARLLGRLGPGPHARRLRHYLQDPTPLVRKAACLAAGESGESELVDDLLQLLVARETRPEARQALARYSDRILDRIELLLNDRKVPTDLRYRLPRLLREIGTPRALEVILFSNPKDDPFLQYRLSTAASRIREAHPDVAFDRKRLVEATLRRFASYEEHLPMARDLTIALGPRNLLVRAVNDRLDQYLESAVRLAAMCGQQRAVLNAFLRFTHGDEKTRPYAIELLEHTVDERALSRPLVALLDRWHRKPDWHDEGKVERAPARLLELVGSKDVVLRAVAVTTVRKLAEARQEAPHDDAEGPSGEGSGIHALARLARGPAWDVLLNTPPVIPEEGPVSEQIVQKVLFLEGTDIFNECDVDDLAAVGQYVREKRFKAGEIIYFENDPGEALYIIVEGRLKLEKDRKVILELGPRDSFGETSLLDNKPQPATATALTDLKVLVLERTDFMDLVSDRVELLRGVFGSITKQLRIVLDAAAAGRITNPSLTPVTTGKVKTAPKTGTAG